VHPVRSTAKDAVSATASRVQPPRRPVPTGSLSTPVPAATRTRRARPADSHTGLVVAIGAAPVRTDARRTRHASAQERPLLPPIGCVSDCGAPDSPGSVGPARRRTSAGSRAPARSPRAPRRRSVTAPACRGRFCCRAERLPASSSQGPKSADTSSNTLDAHPVVNLS
jgi:hypothetical protein